MFNINPETGIRYTVYSCHSLNQDLVQDLFYGLQAKDVSYEEALKDLRCAAVDDVQWRIDEGTLDPEDFDEEVEKYIEARSEYIEIEEPVIEGVYEGVTYGINWLGGAPLLFVTHSPCTGKFRLCSPCVPGACDGNNPDEDGYEGYAVPDDWMGE